MLVEVSLKLLDRRRVLRGLGSGAVLAALAGCKVVAVGGDQQQGSGGFDSTRYAAGIWDSRALPYFTSTAKPIAEVLAAIKADLADAGARFGYRPANEGSPWVFVVSGTGTVMAKNTKSRTGTLTVALDGSPDTVVEVQIGPIIRGSSVRDSLPFVSFKDFTNQLEFADVGKALTALALKAVEPGAAAIAEGQKVSFTGAISLNTASDKIVVTPVALQPAA